MPTIPIRGVGGVGVITDVNPQDAPEISWTDALNMRFAKGEMSRYSVFKYTDESYTYSKVPVGISNIWPDSTSGFITVFSDGTMEEYRDGTARDITPTGSLSLNTSQVSWAFLGNIKYVNREGDVPAYISDYADTQYLPLSGWDSADRCKTLRSYKDFLIALNVTKGINEYEGMVKWSDATQNGAPPSNWDTALDSSLAGETILNDIRGPILDGFPMGDSFMVYGYDQVYRMDYIGAPFVFNITKAFDSFGAMAKNCVAEVDNRHYVFARDDILIHDGLQKQSISNKIVSDKMFSEIDYSKAARCFVYHDKNEHEIVFCYPTTDAQWPSQALSGCNRAAVFNYDFNTWTFIDLPSVVATSVASLDASKTWESFTDWSLENASWGSTAGVRNKNLLVCSAGNAGSSVDAKPYFVDRMFGGRLASTTALEVLWDAYAESANRDMDEVAPNLVGRKQVNCIAPQIRLSDTSHTLAMTVGTSPTPVGDIAWGRRKEFTGYASPKYNLRSNSRYLSFKVDIPSGSYAELSGFDLDIALVAGR